MSRRRASSGSLCASAAASARGAAGGRRREGAGREARPVEQAGRGAVLEVHGGRRKRPASRRCTAMCRAASPRWLSTDVRSATASSASGAEAPARSARRRRRDRARAVPPAPSIAVPALDAAPPARGGATVRASGARASTGAGAVPDWRRRGGRRSRPRERNARAAREELRLGRAARRCMDRIKVRHASGAAGGGARIASWRGARS